jgi:hypothetical protein
VQELISSERRDGAVAAPFITFAGWLWVAGIAAATVALRVRTGTAGLHLATVLHVVGQVVAVGLVMVAGAAAWRRLAPLGRARWVGAAALAWLFAGTLLAADLAGLHHWLPDAAPSWMTALASALLGTALAAAVRVLVARLPRRRGLGLVCLTAGGSLTVLDAILFPVSYAGIHLLGLLVAGAVSALGMRWAVGWWRPRAGLDRVLFPVAAVGAALAVARAPGNQELIVLLREPAAVLAPFLAELRPPLAASEKIPEAQRAWFQDRSTLPDIVPSSPPLVNDPVVVVVGIDSFRADLMADPHREADLPELFRLQRESTAFATARAPGTSTAPSLTAVFSGLYYSQLYWRLMPGAGPDVYADDDPSPRFPELLSDVGIPTATFDSGGFLLNRFGVVRGFREEQTLRTGRAYAQGPDVMNAAIARLERHGSGPLFMFLHMLDPHSPYNRGGKRATPFESYVAEVGLVDRELGRLRQTIERLPLRDRTILIVLSDHGEAFGEHGMTWHGTTLYDELLRVPLMIWSRAIGARRVTDPVSLIDLGPTVLDLMGVPTPARYMGQSLVPYLRGEHPKLTRPIVAEARLMRSLITPQGMKIIHDTRSQTVEVFDLARDPAEEKNLFGPDTEELLGVLRAFFQIHTLRRPDYQVPYRKW